MISTFRWVMSKSGFEQKHPKNPQLSMCVLYMCVACIRTCMKQDTTFIKMFFCFEHKSNFCFSLNPRYDSFGQNTFTKWIIVFVKRNIFRDGKKIENIAQTVFLRRLVCISSLQSQTEKHYYKYRIIWSICVDREQTKNGMFTKYDIIWFKGKWINTISI